MLIYEQTSCCAALNREHKSRLRPRVERSPMNKEETTRLWNGEYIPIIKEDTVFYWSRAYIWIKDLIVSLRDKPLAGERLREIISSLTGTHDHASAVAYVRKRLNEFEKDYGLTTEEMLKLYFLYDGSDPNWSHKLNGENPMSLKLHCWLKWVDLYYELQNLAPIQLP